MPHVLPVSPGACQKTMDASFHSEPTVSSLCREFEPVFMVFRFSLVL